MYNLLNIAKLFKKRAQEELENLYEHPKEFNRNDIWNIPHPDDGFGNFHDGTWVSNENVPDYHSQDLSGGYDPNWADEDYKEDKSEKFPKSKYNEFLDQFGDEHELFKENIVEAAELAVKNYNIAMNVCRYLAFKLGQLPGYLLKGSTIQRINDFEKNEWEILSSFDDTVGNISNFIFRNKYKSKTPEGFEKWHGGYNWNQKEAKHKADEIMNSVKEFYEKLKILFELTSFDETITKEDMDVLKQLFKTMKTEMLESIQDLKEGIVEYKQLDL